MADPNEPEISVPSEILMSLPSYREADHSARKALLTGVAPEYVSSVVASYLLDAAGRGAEAEFASLIEMFQKCRKRERKINKLKLLLATCWTSHYLWLMSDAAGVKYLGDTLDCHVGKDAYKYARKDLQLVRHPKPAPIQANDVPLARDKSLPFRL